MALLSRLKELLGRGRSSRPGRGTVVPVEREPGAESERAVKETQPPTHSADESDSSADGDDQPVETLSGIGPAYAEQLANAGVHTVGELAASDAADLAQATGLGEGRISGWIERAKAS